MAVAASASTPTGSPALCEADREEIKRLVAAIVPAAQVWVFGSRATGQARPYSDLDLLIDSPQPLNWDQRAALGDAFEQSWLTFRVDVVETCAMAPEFRARAWSERIPL
ncbi:nucleotidyltransferase family protein [Sphingomonas sp. NCPPB 2930]